MLQHAFRDGLEIDMTTVPCRLTTYTLALPDRDDSDIYPSTCLRVCLVMFLECCLQELILIFGFKNDVY